MNISEKNRFSLVFGFLAIILIPFVSAQYFGFFDFYNLSDMYQQYYQWFDLIIYYMIFGSLARLVFEKRFGQNEHAVTALYNGVAIFLSLGLVLYESTQLNGGAGGALLLVGGRYIFLIALLIAGAGLYSILRALTGWGFFRCALITSLIILFLVYGLRDVSGINFSETFNDALEWLVVIVAGMFIIFGTIWALRGHNPSNSPIRGPPGPMGPRGHTGSPGSAGPSGSQAGGPTPQEQELRQAIIYAYRACNFSRDPRRIESFLTDHVRRDNLLRLLTVTANLINNYGPTNRFSRPLIVQTRALHLMYNRFDGTTTGSRERGLIITRVYRMIMSNAGIVAILGRALRNVP